MIYFIRNVRTAQVKIGHSLNPRKRLKELQTATPDRLVLLKTVEGDEQTEGDLHDQFAHLRAGGEWFEPGDDLMAYIRSNTPTSFVGKFFHSFTEDGVVNWQGTVVCHIREEFYLVQLFNYLDGTPSCQKLVALNDMCNWDFYDSDAEMREAFEIRHKHSLR